MNLKVYFFIVLFVFGLGYSGFSQQRMIVKPQDFKPYVTSEVSLHNSPSGYFIYSNKTLVSTSFQNIRIFTSGINQSSVSATLLDADPNKIFTGANTNNGVGYYYSLNGGLTWAGGDVLNGSTFFSTNPSCIYGNSNRIHYNYYDNLIVSDRSNDYGYSWLGRMIVPSSALFDMNCNTADVISSSPYYGRVYVAYSDFTLSQPSIFLSYSADGGVTYSSSIQIGQPSANHYEQGCNLQVGPGGVVYCVWSTPGMSNNIEDHIAFTKSADGGASWSAPTNAITINGIRGTALSTNIRVHSFPSMAVDRSGGARNGYIYLCWAQKNLAPAGSDDDICFAYSANGGSTWSTPVRVNDDAINNGKQQFLPRMTVDQANGKIGIVFYDTRDFFNFDSCHTYMAVSTDGGTTFFNMRISSNAQKPSPLYQYADGYYTDYNSVVAGNDVFNAFWTDNRNGPAQIYTSAVKLIPYITHTPLKDNENLNGPYNITASINTFGTALATGETKVIWGRGTTVSDSVVMTNSSGNNWTASIPGNGTSSNYVYYIKTKDNSGRVSTLPSDAPASLFSFRTGPDYTRPQIYLNPFTSVQKNLWPDTATVKVIDNTGIDSVWVSWYINNPSNGYNTFKLSSIGNDFYKGIFNSTSSQVNPNDSIFYRVIARDNSSNHNTDSTSLNKLYIIQFYTITIGSGTSVASYPFRTFNTDSKTDMLFLASELIANGGSQARINQIAFNITSASPQIMNLTIKIKNTTQTTLTGFTSSGWTTFYSGNYTVPGTGWQYITFQNVFIWDGTSNLLLEICFDDNNFNSNTSVLATPMNNMVWFQSADLSSGNGCTDLNGGSAQNYRPNVTFTMNAILGVKENENIIPKDFSLGQNYPNPFNPVTSIKYSIPKNSFVSLKIYDLLGREIETLVSEKQNAGTYISQFSGENLSSGVYFYKLTADDFSEVKRMILIK